jgi:regulator of RNase E activity RraA
MKAIDNLKQDEVLMVCSNKSTRAALWGELLSTASYYRGAKGAIIDGLCRDIRLIKEMNFPVFANGIRPISSKGRCICIDYNCPAEIGGVLVNPGDIVFADADGVVVIPEKIAEDTIQEALKVVERETKTRDELREGSLLSDVFMKYGTL